MAQEMSPQLYAQHLGIEPSTVECWIQGRSSVIFDPRDIREIHGKLKVIAVQAPNASGQGARPRFIPNPNYKYERKRKPKGSVHESGRGGSMDVIPLQDAGIGSVADPAAENVDRDASLGMVGAEGMPKGFQVSDAEAAA